jgi:cytochrome c-type biogenesis protein CcmH
MRPEIEMRPERLEMRRRGLVRSLGRLEILLAVVAIVAIGALSPAMVIAATPRASLPTIERRVMCVTCKIPLIVAQSPQANSERTYIRGLIAEGLTEPQIERAMVGQYGPAVLGLPSTHGFEETVYLVPLAVVLALVATLALLLPRWRRRARVPQESPWVSASGESGKTVKTGKTGKTMSSGAAPELTAGESARLDADLARFDR